MDWHNLASSSVHEQLTTGHTDDLVEAENGLISNTAPLRVVPTSGAYVTTVTIGSQIFELLVDTGSSDTWVFKKSAYCTKKDKLVSGDPGFCNFGPQYKPEDTFHQIPGRHFASRFRDGSRVHGVLGLEHFEVGGIEISDQVIGLVDQAIWNGDGKRSGILGLGREGAVKSYKDRKPEADGIATWLGYDSFVTRMTSKLNMPNMFSLALDQTGGSLAFGYATAAHAPAKFVRTSFLDSNPGYAIELEPTAIVFPASKEIDEAMFEYFHNATFAAYIDSGTEGIWLPPIVADAIAAQYKPPATLNDKGPEYLVDCQAEPPPLAVRITGRNFKIDPKHMVLTEGKGLCVAATMRNPEPWSGHTPSILGTPFLKSVYALFDLEAQELRVGARN